MQHSVALWGCDWNGSQAEQLLHDVQAGADSVNHDIHCAMPGCQASSAGAECPVGWHQLG